MTRKHFLVFLTLVCLLATPCLGAETNAEAAPEATAEVADQKDQKTVTEEPSQPSRNEVPPTLPFIDNLLIDKEAAEFAGCTAWYPCVHGGSVSCSGPTGTCISSGQGCGLVSCNGQTTFCPGACNTNWSCATFCYTTYGSLDGYCSSLKCCVCL